MTKFAKNSHKLIHDYVTYLINKNKEHNDFLNSIAYFREEINLTEKNDRKFIKNLFETNDFKLFINDYLDYNIILEKNKINMFIPLLYNNKALEKVLSEKTVDRLNWTYSENKIIKLRYKTTNNVLLDLDCEEVKKVKKNCKDIDPTSLFDDEKYPILILDYYKKIKIKNSENKISINEYINTKNK